MSQGMAPRWPNWRRSLRGLMRRNINRKSQSRLVRDLNRQFTEAGEDELLRHVGPGDVPGESRSVDDMQRGPPAPIVVSSGYLQLVPLSTRTKQMNAGRLTNLPLGIEDSTYYPQVTLNLDLGDIVLDLHRRAYGSIGRGRRNCSASRACWNSCERLTLRIRRRMSEAARESS